MPTDSGLEHSDHALIQYLADPIYRARGWIKFLAVLSFIGGGMYAITIIGLLFAWLPIMIGVFLWQSATAIENGYNQIAAEQVHKAHDKLRLIFITYGILAIVGIVLFIVFFGTFLSNIDEITEGFNAGLT